MPELVLGAGVGIWAGGGGGGSVQGCKEEVDVAVGKRYTEGRRPAEERWMIGTEHVCLLTTWRCSDFQARDIVET
jgi:hypothetical protein